MTLGVEGVFFVEIYATNLIPVENEEVPWYPSQVFCLMTTDPEDNVADYYQQQVEMLEGFNEMDALAERGFVSGMSRVCIISCSLFLLNQY